MRTKNELRVRKGQVYKSNHSPMQVEIMAQKDGRWLTRVLTEKRGVYKGSHTLTEYSLRKGFTLIE